MALRVICSVSDRDNWTLRPYSYLFNRYWSSLQPVIVAGYTKPDFDLPDNFEFHSIDNYNYPAHLWSNGLLKFFESFQDEHFVFTYSDFWLRRTVNHAAIGILHDYALNHPNVYRIDLGTDRLFAHDNRYVPDYTRWGCLNLIQSNPDWPYHHSTQAGLFRRDKFIQLLRPGWTPWQFELEGAALLAEHPDWLVLGTRQIVVDYVHSMVSGSASPILEGIDPEHISYMSAQGWLP